MLASAAHMLKRSFAHTHIPWARGAILLGRTRVVDV